MAPPLPLMSLQPVVFAAAAVISSSAVHASGAVMLVFRPHAPVPRCLLPLLVRAVSFSYYPLHADSPLFFIGFAFLPGPFVVSSK